MRKVMPLAVLLVMLLGFASPAGAGARPLEGDEPRPRDEHPCGEPYLHTPPGEGELLVQDCDLWRDHVPVYELTSDGSGFHLNQIGELKNARGNWFKCQEQLPERPYRVPGTQIVNDWWAHTMADNLRGGFVPVAYFAGGGNNQPDGNLRIC